MDTQRVSLITLGVAGLGRARAFYTDLGWREHPRSQDAIAFFQLHGAVLGLFDRAALADDQGRPGADLGTGAVTLAQNFSTEAEVDAAYARALTCGGTGLKQPQGAEWGATPATGPTPTGTCGRSP